MAPVPLRGRHDRLGNALGHATRNFQVDTDAGQAGANPDNGNGVPSRVRDAAGHAFRPDGSTRRMGRDGRHHDPDLRQCPFGQVATGRVGELPRLHGMPNVLALVDRQRGPMILHAPDGSAARPGGQQRAVDDAVKPREGLGKAFHGVDPPSS